MSAHRHRLLVDPASLHPAAGRAQPARRTPEARREVRERVRKEFQAVMQPWGIYSTRPDITIGPQLAEDLARRFRTFYLLAIGFRDGEQLGKAVERVVDALMRIEAPVSQRRPRR